MGDLYHNISYPADFKLGTLQASKLMMGTVQVWPRVAAGFTELKLFNYFAIAGTGNKSIAASGWRIPTKADWDTLSTNLGGDTISGGKLKEAGTTHWETPNTGADNSSGFNGLPVGIRLADGSFQYTSIAFDGWASDDHPDNYGVIVVKGLSYLYDDLIPTGYYKVLSLIHI